MTGGQVAPETPAMTTDWNTQTHDDGATFTASPTTHRDYDRLTRDLCGDCWQDVRPDEYLPAADRYGTCARCGWAELVARSYIGTEV